MRSVQSFAQMTSLILVSVFTIFSCQPRDQDLKAVANALKANQNNNSNSKTVNQIQMTKSEKNAVLALSMDRIAESIFLMKAVVDPKFASQNSLKVDQAVDSQNSDQLPPTRLFSYPSEANSQKLMNTTANVNYNVDDRAVDPSGKLSRLVLVNNIFELIEAKGDLKNKKGDFVVKNISDRIVIKVTSDPNIYLIKITRIDQTSSKADKNTTLNFEAKFELAWDGQVSKIDQPMLISNLMIKSVRSGGKNGEVVLITESSDLTLQIGKCASMNGRISVKSEDKSNTEQKMTNPTEIILTDSTVEIPSQNFKSQAADCEIRPIVDLTRMLN
jgi:hypothetical protein